MMKTTQFLTNIKFWQSSLVALLFLFSFTVNSQSVGDDLMAASNGALSTLSDDAVNGVDGQGGGCVPCGWSGAAGVNYAPTTAGHGPVHSGDRMWKTFAGNGGNGEFVNQVFTDIAAGTYTLTFYHRWTNAGNLDYSAGPGPQVTFKQSDGNGGWLDGYAAEVPQGNIGANAEWTANVHTIEVAEAGTYRMQVYKNGGTGANPNPMNGCLHLDTFSLVYDAAPAEPGCDLTIAMTDSYGDSWNDGQLVVSVNGVEQGVYANVDADGSSPNSGGETQTVALSVSYGDEVTFDFTCGGWCDETSFVVTDADGNEVASGGGADDADATFACAAPVETPDLTLQGIMDFDIGGSDGKAIHVRALNYIQFLDVYGLGVANNGGGTDGEEYIFEPIQVEAGADILVARNPDVIMAYLASTETVFDHVLLAPSAISQNGDDAIELYQYDSATATSNVVEVFGDPDVDGTGEAWEYTDSWAYKVDGEWTYGELGCAGGETSCASSCPYPLIADFCPTSSQIDCFVGEAVVDAVFGSDPTSFASTIEVVAEEGAVVGDVDLYVNVSHVWNGDVDMYLTSPSGTTVTLTLGNGGSSDDYSDTIFDDDAEVSILDGTGPFSGSYMPEQALSTLNGEPANGTWTLLVEDNYPSIDDGVFNYWGLGVCSAPPPVHDVTFNVDARNIIVHDKGMYMGGGIFGGADAVAMSDEDGDGIWSVTLSIEEGTTGNWAFFNSPGDGGDWGTKENLEGQACADAANFNDRVVPAFDADNLEFNFCFAVCNDTNSFCAETVERANVTFTVGTADIEVGANGMFVGGGAFGGSNGHAMADNGDDTHSVTISVPVGLTGHYAFFNSPGTHYDWGTKEQLEGLECGDSDNFNDRPLAEVTGDTSISFCFGTCETECAVPNNGIAEFPACFDFEGDAAFDGWQTLELNGGTSDWNASPYWIDIDEISGPASVDGVEPNGTLRHFFLPPDVAYNDLVVSPQFNTSGMTDAQLSYYEYVLDGEYGTQSTVWVSTDEVLSLESENLQIVQQGIYPVDGEWNQVVLDLPEAEYVTVIFQYEGTYGHAWAIDDMCVEEVPAEPNFVTADPNNAWGGYMEVFDLDGNFQFGSPWDVADLQTVLQPDVPNMILYPNFNAYNADDPYWSNGEMGNKIMRATTQVESWDMYNGADLTFTGSVAEHTLDESYDAVYFIKCLDPDAGWTDMLEAAYVLPLPESGEFSVSVSGDLLPAGKLVQFGFSVIGLNANPAFDYGKVVIGDVGLSIGENDSLDMVIYPNPVDGDYVTIQTPLNGDKLVEVFDVNGRKVMERLLTTDTLNVSSISAGMYIVKVTVEDQSNVSKLIIE